MRDDQIEAFKPICEGIVNKILSAIFGGIGVTCVADILPNPEELIVGMIKSMYGEGFTEQDVDEIIAFNLKYKDKVDAAALRSEEFINKYFTDNQDVIETMLIKFQGE